MSQNENESLVYGVDYHGKVWYVNTNPSKGPGTSWTLLANPSNISIKRVVSFNHLLWGISSDHQIYVHIPKRDIPIRIREEIYENQRWNPVEGFCSHLLPTDRSPFSNEDGMEVRYKNDNLPSESWKWEGEWQIENTFENQLISEGWSYAIDFPAAYVPVKSWKSCVRRRKLFRYRKYIGTNRWNRIEPLQEDHTSEPFIDVGIGGLNTTTNDDICCLWAVSILGQVYFRTEVSALNPEGSRWQTVPIRKGLEACQVSVGGNGVPFVVAWTGSFMYRIGLTPQNPSGTDWLEANGPDGGLLQLSAGFNTLWALTRDKKCWALKGDLQEVIVQSSPLFEWIEIPGRMKSISVGRSDAAILALPEDESGSLFLRFGISDDQRHGQGWKEAFPDISWDTLSIQSTISDISDTTDGSGDHLSLKPDIPQSSPFTVDSDIPAVVSFCWVDGGCVSTLKSVNDNDLEVGPWREEILHNLQQLKIDRKDFEYPNAIEESSTSWSKSVRCKMLHASKKSGWASGQLEISNNDTLVFHKNLESSWMCSVADVLSVLSEVAGSFCLTFRIRNGIESGVADFVTFQFLSGKDAEEWGSVITELSYKPQDHFSIANIWLTTQGGEILQAGLLKISDTPTEVEVITPLPGDDLKLHHPLVRGFLPGSEIHVDISIPTGADKFSLNLKGRDVTAFHFNPRLSNATVVRNSQEKEGWGMEERDGVFPFREGHSYTVTIQCTQSHLMTTVTQKKHKFIFSYKHRILPKVISSFTVNGDVSVSSIRYDPKIGEDNYQLEFVSTAVPGHCWKVESAPGGMVWGLGYDFSVWCNTGSTKSQKSDNSHLHLVTDEQTFCVYENQRWNPLTGFGTHSLPTDRHGWTDETGRIRMEKDEIRLPSGRWSWISDWEVDYDLKPAVDQSGWQYAVDFPASYHSSKRLNDFVRRRRWKRMCRFTTSGPWLQIPNMKLVDLSIRMNEDCEWEVLGLCKNGDVVVRCGITPECPLGDRWESIPSEKPFVSISSWFGQRVWAVGKDGFSYIRYGNTWQLLDRPSDTPLKAVKVGPSGVWAIGTNNGLYRRTEIQTVFPEGREWVRVCDGVTQVCMASDGSVWALLKAGEIYRCTLAKRMGISQNNPNGIGWELIAAGPWRTCTVAGSFSRNR